MIVGKRMASQATMPGQILVILIWISLSGAAWGDDWTISGSNTTVSSGTRVGIGISNPTSTLEVNGPSQFHGLLSASVGVSIPTGTGLVTDISGSTRTLIARSGTSLNIGENGGWTVLNNRLPGNGQWVVEQNGTTKLYLNSSGRFIVNSISDHGETFQVSGNAYVSGPITSGAAASGTGSAFVASSTNPTFTWIDTDGSANEKNWDVQANAGAFTFRTRTDGNASGQSWLTATRSGTAITAVSLTAPVTMSSTLNVASDLTMGGGSGSPIMSVDGAVSGNHGYALRSAGSLRWRNRLASAEVGSNTGGNLEWQAFQDNGALIDVPMMIARVAGGPITMNRPVSISSTLGVAGAITSNKYGGGSSAGLMVSSAAPAIGWRETDASADNQYWDFLANGSTLSLRAVNDANSSSASAMTVARSGATISGINFPPPVTMSSSLEVAGDLTVGTVKARGWEISEAPDYVFEKEYRLDPLKKVESFVRKNKHLPEVPSAKQMKEEGLDLVKMNFLLLKKVEELTLHAIQQEKRVEAQEEKIAKLEKRLLETRGAAQRQHLVAPSRFDAELRRK